MRNNNKTGGLDKITIWFVAGFVVLAVVVVIVAGVLSGGFETANNANTPAGFVATVSAAVNASDHVRGDATSTVSLIEYGDYECPACEEYQPMVRQALADYGTKIAFVFRNFPLYSIHPLAGIAAQAAEAAALQGKFWEMHDALYASSSWSEWTTATPANVVGQYFDKYAEQIGLNVAQFDKDITSSGVTSKISADVASADAASVDHTPTFFVDLKQIPNPANYSDLKAAIDAALASSTTSTAP